MRIFRNSTAEYLLIISTAYGQLPYHALTFLSLPYENVKDAFQKLCRAGYLETVKAPGHKSFFITDAGYAAYYEAMKRSTKPQYWDEIPDKPEFTRNIQKAIRLSRINEAQMFFFFLGLAPYRTSLEVKREMEEKAVRSSDNLKYSRFAGVTWRCQQASLVYHFGNGNQRLNANGERNAAALFSDYKHPCGKFILTETEKGLVDILEYSLWVLNKSSRELRHMHLNYHITYEDNAILLPLTRDAGDFIRAFRHPHWPQTVPHLEEDARPNEGIFLSTLNGTWMDVLVYLSEAYTTDMPVTFAVWDIQLPILRELTRRGLLPGGWQAVSYHTKDLCNGILPFWYDRQGGLHIPRDCADRIVERSSAERGC